ncbi:MAG TPA: DUF1289 domain-containing protein [Pelomicrobium sp.]|nr:DUF1289 domain-containing protein [Pelomicrobium sp.]
MVPSPCINVCVIDPGTGWCRGCLRTLDEVAGWTSYSDVEKQAVLDRLRDRRQAAGSAAIDRPSAAD